MWDDGIWVEVGRQFPGWTCPVEAALTLISPSHRQAWAEGWATLNHTPQECRVTHPTQQEGPGGCMVSWSRAAPAQGHSLLETVLPGKGLLQATSCVDLCESSLVCMPQGDCPRIQHLVPFVPNSKYPLVRLLRVFIVLNLCLVMLSFLLLL